MDRWFHTLHDSYATQFRYALSMGALAKTSGRVQPRIVARIMPYARTACITTPGTPPADADQMLLDLAPSPACVFNTSAVRLEQLHPPRRGRFACETHGLLLQLGGDGTITVLRAGICFAERLSRYHRPKLA